MPRTCSSCLLNALLCFFLWGWNQELSIWAYPTSAGLMEDNLICSISGNPEPVVFHLCCQGVQVVLGVSPRQLHFDRLLLHRSVLPPRRLCWGHKLLASSLPASFAGSVATQMRGWLLPADPVSCSPFVAGLNIS